MPDTNAPAAPEPVTQPDAPASEPPKPPDYKGKLRTMIDALCSDGRPDELEQAYTLLRPLVQSVQARL